MLKALCTLFLLMPRLVAVAAAAPSSMPSGLGSRPDARVNDFAHVFSPAELTRLEKRFASFEKDTGHQAVAVLVRTLDGIPIEDAASAIFEQWRLGDKDRNDGVLLLIAVLDRKVRIEVGYGLEGKIPDATAKKIIAEDLSPFFRENQFATAILVFENRLRQILKEDQRAVSQSKTASNGVSPLAFALFFLGFPLGMALLRKMLGRLNGAGRGNTYRSGGIYRGNDGWWGGGGGFGGGGGLSGGGGASGDW